MKQGNPCIYKGVLHRSKMEARWALHFDFFNIQAQYEPERFSARNKPYLPDFYLKEKGFYIEVKPNFEKFIEEKERYIAFADENKKSIACCIGLPCAFKWQWFYRKGVECGIQIGETFMYKQPLDLNELKLQHQIAYACQFSSFQGKDPYILPVQFERVGTELIIEKPE